MIATGVARPNAHGHADDKHGDPLPSVQRIGFAAINHQPRNVAAAMPITMGTNAADNPVSQPLRANPCRPARLLPERRSGPRRCAAPPRWHAPSVHPACVHAGTYDGVADGLIDRYRYAGEHGFRSTALAPPMTSLSVGIFSPGRIRNISSDDDVIDRDEHVDAPPNHPGLLGA